MAAGGQRRRSGARRRAHAAVIPQAADGRGLSNYCARPRQTALFAWPLRRGSTGTRRVGVWVAYQCRAAPTRFNVYYPSTLLLFLPPATHPPVASRAASCVTASVEPEHFRMRVRLWAWGIVCMCASVQPGKATPTRARNQFMSGLAFTMPPINPAMSVPGCFSFCRRSNPGGETGLRAPTAPKALRALEAASSDPCFAPRDSFSLEQPPAYSTYLSLAPEVSCLRSRCSHQAWDTIKATVDEYAERLTQLSLWISDHPEPGFSEHGAHKRITSFLSDEGFDVQRGFKLPTAFRASYTQGSGRTFAFNSRYDALPGVGHACRHNLIAVSGIAAAGAAPWDGINALGPVNLAYSTIWAMRQQIRPTDRVHGIITKRGDAPNNGSCGILP